MALKQLLGAGQVGGGLGDGAERQIAGGALAAGAGLPDGVTGGAQGGDGVVEVGQGVAMVAEDDQDATSAQQDAPVQQAGGPLDGGVERGAARRGATGEGEGHAEGRLDVGLALGAAGLAGEAAGGFELRHGGVDVAELAQHDADRLPGHGRGQWRRVAGEQVTRPVEGFVGARQGQGEQLRRGGRGGYGVRRHVPSVDDRL